MTDPLLPARFLFRFSVPCRYRDPLWTDKGAQLEEEYRLIGLAELDGRAAWADVRAAWSEAGLAFAVHVRGKSQPPWCRASRPEDSDGLQVWIDTRDVHNVHRANRFCHRFVVLPAGKKGTSLILPSRATGPVVPKSVLSPFFLPIHRAREQPNPIRGGLLDACCEIRGDGYNLEVLIPTEALTGFDPAEHPRLGFTYAVLDRELGEQTFTVGSPMPYPEDPSLWATLELQR